MAKDVDESFVQEFVIGLGLLGGMGVDPEGEILNALNQAMHSVNPSTDFTMWIILLSVLVTVISVASAFFIGGIAGIIAVAFAFIGGLFIETQFGVWCLIIGIFLGFFSPKLKSIFPNR